MNRASVQPNCRMKLACLSFLILSRGCWDRHALPSTVCAQVPRPSELTRAGRIGARPVPVVCERRAVGTTPRPKPSKSMRAPGGIARALRSARWAAEAPPHLPPGASLPTRGTCVRSCGFSECGIAAAAGNEELARGSHFPPQIVHAGAAAARRAPLAGRRRLGESG